MKIGEVYHTYLCVFVIQRVLLFCFVHVCHCCVVIVDSQLFLAASGWKTYKSGQCVGRVRGV